MRALTFPVVIVLAGLIAVGCGTAATSDDAGAAIAAAVVDASASNEPAPSEEAPSESASSEEAPSDEISSDVISSDVTSNDDFPDILEASATQDDSGAWTFAVTVSSPYDTPQRYADAWRVVDADGNELGIRVLAHDHANEQPFTRSQSGILIPEGITEVTIQGRDLVNGWGGGELTYTLP